MNNLKTIREANNLSQSQLAEKAGINVRILQYYEQGANDINKAQAIKVYKLARALGCKMEDILNLEGVE